MVTGGGGVGLGQACCQRLASLGASIAVCDVDREAATRVAGAVHDRWGVATAVVVASVSDWTQVKAGVEQAVAELGGLDVLVNNAGWGLRPAVRTVRPDRPIERRVARRTQPAGHHVLHTGLPWT